MFYCLLIRHKEEKRKRVTSISINFFIIFIPKSGYKFSQLTMPSLVYLCLLEKYYLCRLSYLSFWKVSNYLTFICICMCVYKCILCTLCSKCLFLSIDYCGYIMWKGCYLSCLKERDFLTLAQASEVDVAIGRYCYVSFGTKQDSRKEYTRK